MSLYPTIDDPRDYDFPWWPDPTEVEPEPDAEPVAVVWPPELDVEF